MMHLAAALLVGMLSPGPDGDKAALRYKFEKGEKFQFKLSYTMNTKIDEIPDEFKGVFGDGPIEMRFECLMDAEVTEIDKDGKAAIEGKWRRMKAKGNMLTEVDFAYDADKPGETSGDPDAYNDIEEQFREASRRPVKLTVDRAGRLTVAPSPGKSAEAAQLLTLNGLMGALPEAAVGVGDSWKGEHALNAPGLAGAVDLRIQSDNTYKSDEGGCAVLTSKFTVAAVEGKDGGGADVKLKIDGDGQGKTLFRIKEGRTASSANQLTIRIQATIPGANDGSDVPIKMTVSVDQAHEILK